MAASSWLSTPLRRAGCFALLLVVAKAGVVALRVLDGGGARLASPWAPAAMLYLDVWAALAWLVLDLAVAAAARRAARAASGVMWLLYAAAAGYVAFNVPVTRVFASPLTWPILGAAGGALSDSIKVYLTPANLTAMGAVCLAAALLPPWLRRAQPGRRAAAAAGAVAALLVAVGPAAAARVETLGLHRNALVTLATTALAERRGVGGADRLPDDDPLVPSPDGASVDLRALAGAARGRNVLWVVLESTAARYLKPYGAAGPDYMPRLTELSRQAIVFDSAYAAYPESIKGLFGVLCATPPAAQTRAESYTAALIPCQSVAERFGAAGYRTAMFHSGWFVYLGMRHVIDGRGFQQLDDAGAVGARFKSSFGVDEPSTVRRVLEWIDAGPADRPFFAMYLPIAGHHPYHAPGDGPRPFGEKEEIDSYGNDLYQADLALGALLDGLRARHLDDKTLIVVMGDHGEAFHQHEGNFAHTLYLYEENVHVPLLVAAPGLDWSRRAPQAASVTDVAPTLLALVGETAPPRWQGRSLLAPTLGVARFYTDHALWQVGLRDGPWKFIHEVETGRSRLYHLGRDPDERDNLAPTDGERARRYRGHLLAWSARQRARLLGYRRVVAAD